MEVKYSVICCPAKAVGKIAHTDCILINADNRSFRDQIRKQGQESIGLSLSIPIFNRFAYRNRIRMANHSVSRMELESAKLNIQKEINQAYQSAVSARAKYVSSTKALAAAQEAYDYAVERYEVGRSTVYELSEAQTKLLISRSEQLQAKYDYIFQSKILNFYKGEPIIL